MTGPVETDQPEIGQPSIEVDDGNGVVEETPVAPQRTGVDDGPDDAVEVPPGPEQDPADEDLLEEEEEIARGGNEDSPETKPEGQ